MKLFIAALALATVAAAPVLAQEPARHAPKAHHTRGDAAPGAYNQYGRTEQRGHSANPAYDVYDSKGRYVSSDPDPLVRMDLFRDNASNTE